MQVTRIHALIFMLICLLVAATLRLPDLDTTPPGLHYDEAANALLASEIGLKGERPIFNSSYTGKEVLFFYLAGGLMRLTGESVFTLRLTAAFVGLLTVAAVYWLGREWLLDSRIALLAVALLAVSFWHLLFSHLGFRAISQPLLQTVTLAALFRGIRRQQWLWLLVGGIFLGLTAYTYLAARLFPVLLLLAALPLLRYSRQRWGQLAAFTIIGLLVLAPLLNYFITHPDAFWVRIGQVAPDSEGLRLEASFLKSLGMFFVVGDPYWRFNLPGRPLFNWFWGGLMLIGWAVCITRLRRVPYDWQKSALLLLILAPLVMLLPAALATNEIVPSNLRAIGLIPFVFYLPAIGLMAFLTTLSERFPKLSLTPTALTIGMAVLLVGGIFTDYLYFDEWAALPELYYESDGDLTAVAQFLDETDLDDTTIYVASEHYQHPTLAFLSQQYERVKWLPQSQALVFPAQGPAIYIYPHNSPRPEWAERYLPTQLSTEQYKGPDGELAFTAYTLTGPLAPPAPIPTDINFGNTIDLVGYGVESTTVAEKVSVTLFWRVNNRPTADIVPFIHLEDNWQHRWGQKEISAYPSPQWEVGEFIIEQVELPVTPGLPPGQYRLRVGLFNPASGEALARFDEVGRYAGDAYFIENVTLAAAPTLPEDIPQPPHVIDQHVRPGLRLLGYERGKTAVSSGEPIDLALWWQATEAQPNLITRLEIVRADNTGLILANTLPVHGTYPFETWTTPQFLIDRLSPRVPDSFPSGQYRLSLRLLDGADNTVITADLGFLTIEKTDRLFTKPDATLPQAAVFGNEIELVGYDLTPLENGQATLTLYWQARQAPSQDYTVFVHVLAKEDGACCVWQQDVMPQQNQYPTTRWLSGEYVVDSYLITPDPPLTPGRYPIEIGLYLAETGRRLSASVPGQQTRDVLFLRPLEVND